MGRGFLNTPLFQRLVLSSTLQDATANVSTNELKEAIEFGTAHTDLRPMGKIKLGEEIVPAKTMGEFITEGENVKVIGREMQYYVVERTQVIEA